MNEKLIIILRRRFPPPQKKPTTTNQITKTLKQNTEQIFLNGGVITENQTLTSFYRLLLISDIKTLKFHFSTLCQHLGFVWSQTWGEVSVPFVTSWRDDTRHCYLQTRDYVLCRRCTRAALLVLAGCSRAWRGNILQSDPLKMSNQ